MATVEFQLDTKDFEDTLAQWASRSRKSGEEILRQQAKLIVRNVVNLTPPGKEGVSGTSAKKRGETTIKSDLGKLFQPVRKAQAQEVNIAAIHKGNRNNKGRVKRPGTRIRVYSADYNKYLRERVKKVGALAAGWNRASARLGHRPPAWIWRHSSPGHIVIDTSEDRIAIRMTNKVSYASDMSGIQNRVQRAVRQQENKMRRQLENMLARTAQK